MSQEYSSPEREDDPHALPDLEVFELTGAEIAADGEPLEPGFYWWSCFPGCMPDGAPMGPYETYEEALDDARGDCE